MRILVAYASKHGATKGIAERIAARLSLAGHQAEARPVPAAGDPATYDAVVIGSACYNSHWRKDATVFVRRHRRALAARPVWLFSSGPLGTAVTDASGRDVRSAAVPLEIADFVTAVHPREHRVFFGALDPARLTWAERSLRRLPGVRTLMPAGDFRDWPEIERWADGIARSLAATSPAGHPGRP